MIASSRRSGSSPRVAAAVPLILHLLRRQTGARGGLSRGALSRARREGAQPLAPNAESAIDAAARVRGAAPGARRGAAGGALARRGPRADRGRDRARQFALDVRGGERPPAARRVQGARARRRRAGPPTATGSGSSPRTARARRIRRRAARRDRSPRPLAGAGDLAGAARAAAALAAAAPEEAHERGARHRRPATAWPRPLSLGDVRVVRLRAPPRRRRRPRRRARRRRAPPLDAARRGPSPRPLRATPRPTGSRSARAPSRAASPAPTRKSSCTPRRPSAAGSPAPWSSSPTNSAATTSATSRCGSARRPAVRVDSSAGIVRPRRRRRTRSSRPRRRWEATIVIASPMRAERRAERRAPSPAVLITAPIDPVRLGAANRALERAGIPWRFGARAPGTNPGRARSARDVSRALSSRPRRRRAPRRRRSPPWRATRGSSPGAATCSSRARSCRTRRISRARGVRPVAGRDAHPATESGRPVVDAPPRARIPRPRGPTRSSRPTASARRVTAIARRARGAPGVYLDDPRRRSASARSS